MDTYEITFELRRRKNRSPLTVNCAQGAIQYLKEHCFKTKDMWREKAVVLCLNAARNILCHYTASIGGGRDTVIEVGDIARAAIAVSAPAVILCHNHPSGDSRPSVEDINITGNIRKGLATLDIKLIDHIILGFNEFYSFAEESKTEIKPTKKQ